MLVEWLVISVNNTKSEKLNFSVSTHIKDIIGRDLITSDIIAIFELVKNSYDANAKNVYIDISPLEDTIVIADDGHGMSYEDLRDKWLFLAYSEKTNQTKRAYAGSKGIGRFSADRLGAELVLRSKKNGIISEIVVDWQLFQKNQKEEFTSIQVDYSELSSDSFLDKCDSGTVLTISKLRDKWTLDRIYKVEKDLAALINPINTGDNNLKIQVEYSGLDGNYSNIVRNTIKEVLIEKTASINALIKNDTIEIELRDSGKTIYSVKLKNHTILNDVSFLIYYMNTKAKLNFSLLMKENLLNYGNIFVYKNNFRVMPYGEPDYDTFNLNLRKTQGYNRYLGLRETLGWISITDINNDFKEVSSRDAGFIKNNNTFALEETYMELIHRPLEDYMQVIKFGNLDIDDLLDNSEHFDIEKLLNRFKKYEIVDLVKYQLPVKAIDVSSRIEMLDAEETSVETKEEIKQSLKEVVYSLAKEAKQQKKEKEKLDKQVAKLKRELDVKSNIILKKKPDRQSFLEHELRKISNDMRVLNLRINDNIPEETKKKILPYLAKYMRLADKLLVIQQIVLRVDNNTKVKKQRININSYIMTYFENIADISNLNVEIKINEDIEVMQDIDVFDFGVLIDNIVINAQDHGATKLNVSVTEGELAFISDTPAIKVNPINKVFELGYSTKDRGLGMGLYIVQQISNQFGWTNSVDNLTDNLVAFTFKFKGASE